MPANKEWYFDVKDSYTHIVKNATQETNGPVFAIKASQDKIRVYYAEEMKRKRVTRTYNCNTYNHAHNYTLPLLN